MELDLIINNAQIITMNSHRSRATRIGVWKGRIIGLDEEIEQCTARRRIDANHAVIVPGFYDVHNHMSAFGQRLQEIDASKFDRLDDLYSAIRHQADSSKSEWITASGYDQVKMGGHPTRTALDDASRGKKVLVVHRTSHMLVASTPVFQAVGALSSSYQVPEGGEIDMDEGGVPTGLVLEQAMADFRNLRKPVPIDQLIQNIELASQQFASEGLTSVAEAGIGVSPIVGSSPVELAAYQRGHEENRLSVRTQLMVAMENFHALDGSSHDDFSLGIDLGMRTGFGNSKLSLGPVKLFTDGALMSRTASMTENFCGHNHAGIMQYGYEQLTDIAASAHAAGWQIAMHAIGDHAIDVALDVLQEAASKRPRKDARHRIEHASVVRADQLSRFQSQNIVPSPQNQFVFELGEGVRNVLGEDRLPWTYRMQSFLEAGLRVPGSSDRPIVTDGSPLSAIQAMVTRLTQAGNEFNPAEAITPFEALRSYTWDSAYASHEDHIKGCLSSGYLADFVVLDENPLTVDPAEIGSIPILATYVDGEPTYSAQDSWT